MRLLRKLNQLFGNFTTHNGVIVLTYHRINDKLPKGELIVHPKDFARQIMFLNFYRRQFEVISAADMVKWIRQDSPCFKTKIVITFDDGYRDNYIYAFPILKRCGFPALISLTTDYIGTDYKKERYKDLSWKRDYLNIDEIKEMAEHKIDFGAHTATHKNLNQIDIDRAELEMLKSYDYIKKATRQKDIAFCYPYGDYNENVKNIVKKLGFMCALSVKPGINYKSQDLFEIKRIDVSGNDNFSSFKYKVTDKYA